MRGGRWLIVLALVAACGEGGTRTGTGTAAAPAGTTDGEDLARKIGELVMVGFRGAVFDGASPLAQQVRAGQVGGVVLFDVDVASGGSRNIASPEQVRKLVGALQSAAPAPLLVGIDQEGGRVSRLKEQYGFPPTASAQQLGGRDDVAATRAEARRTASTLAGLGINLNFAPALDVDVNPASPAIGALGRSFSGDPAVVTRHARAVIEAHHAEGVLTAVKHFPGHGSATGDTHLGFVDVTETWSRAELEPFRTLIAEGAADMVMTAHVRNERLDPQWPATLSPATIDGLLRRDLAFSGVVISDDLQMGAIADHYGLKAALRHALLAGVDMLLLANNTPRGYVPDIAPRAVSLVAELVEEGAISEARIDESVARVRALKEGLPR